MPVGRCTESTRYGAGDVLPDSVQRFAWFARDAGSGLLPAASLALLAAMTSFAMTSRALRKCHSAKTDFWDRLRASLHGLADARYTFKAIGTNRLHKAATVVAFHEGRGEQEGVIAHNLGRELQIEIQPGIVRNVTNRASLWFCHELSTLRRQLLWQPGRLIRPGGTLTLALADNDRLRHRFMSMREALVPNAAAS